MRIRTIKPEFWSHPITGRWRGELQAFAISLLNEADDEGYLYADPISVRSAVRPFDEDSTNVRRMLDELSQQGWIELKKHPQRGVVGRILTFEKHQRIDRGRKSEISEYFNESEVITLDEDSTKARRGLDEGSTLERKGKEQGKEGKGKDAPAERAPRESDRLCEDFKEILKEDYRWQNAKDGVAFAALRKQFSLDEIRDRWRKGLTGSGWQQVRTVAQLASKWNDLAGDITNSKSDWLKRRNQELAEVHVEGEVRL